MPPDPVESDTPTIVRAMLDGFDVAERLRYIRDFIWRGGTLEFGAGRLADTGPALDAGYVLIAQWPAAAFERTTVAHSSSIVPSEASVVDGRWVRTSAGYELRVGINLAAPSAIYIRAPGFSSLVPIVGRSVEQVEVGLQTELGAYSETFLSRYPTVPQAIAFARRRLDQLGLRD